VGLVLKPVAETAETAEMAGLVLKTVAETVGLVLKVTAETVGLVLKATAETAETLETVGLVVKVGASNSSTSMGVVFKWVGTVNLMADPFMKLRYRPSRS
jgi:TPP-dependent indolepyruvate ferredoxin oxidoreductase alpha subunit